MADTYSYLKTTQCPTTPKHLTEEATRLNQLMESNMRERTHDINAAVNFNQLMGFDNTEEAQSYLDDYLMAALEMEDSHYNGVNIQ